MTALRILLCLALGGLWPCSAAADISFSDRSATSGFEPGFLANIFGGGIAVADFDRNGYPDIFVTGFFLPNRLYFNNGDGTFSEDPAITADIAGSQCSSVAAADYDNDGWPDIYVGCRNQSNLLLRNQSGQGFSNQISALIDHDAASVNSPRVDAVAWGDLDGNGFVDLYIGVYPTSSQPDLSNPDNLDRILLNRGGGEWINLTASYTGNDRAALSRTALARAFSDFNLDGRLDLYVVNDKLQGNTLWTNIGSGCAGWCLSDQSISANLTRPVFGMGLAVGDVDRNGIWDVYFSSIDEQVLLRGSSVQPLNFIEDTDSPLNFAAVGWSTIFADFDNDGWEDAFLATNSGSFSTTTSVDQLFRNQGDGTFTTVTEGSGLDTVRPSEAAALIDMNRDGRLDLVIGHWNETVGYRIYENLTPDTGHWIGFRLDGGEAVNRSALGTRIVLDDGLDTQQMRELRSGEARGGNHEPVLHFGLGEQTEVSATLHWPDGTVQVLSDLAINQYHEVTHPGSEVVFSDRFDAQ